MKLIIAQDYEDMSKKAANIVAEEIKKKPDIVLGFATGFSPIGMYKELVKMFKTKKINFSKVKTFNLDEYIGLEPTNPKSYNFYMNKNLFSSINIKKQNIRIPCGIGDIEKNILEYEKAIKEAGGIDLQILGIGTNAHIAFNEPGSDPNAGVEVVNLSKQTIKDNSKYFASKEEVPKTAISMGIGIILKAKKIILLASGKNKAKAIKKTFKSKISKKVPSSYLRNHRNVIVIADKEAARFL